METLKKSEQTYAMIVDVALEIASKEGISQLSLASIAKQLGISKSGVFSRVGSLEALQHEVLNTFEQRFVEEVFVPAMSLQQGLPRLNAIIERWIGRVCDSRAVHACLFVAGAFEGEELGIQLRERLREGVVRLQMGLRRTILQAIDVGDLRPDTDPEQLIFEIYSFIVGSIHDIRFLEDQNAEAHMRNAYARIISTYRSFQYQQ